MSFVKYALVILPMAITALVVAACASQPVTPEPLPTEPANTPSPASLEKTVFVGPVLVDCVGVGPQKCMLIKENPEDEYTMFYDQIEGFDFEEGYEYELIILEERIENPPADASNLKWTLVSVVSKTPVEAASEEGIPSELYALDWYVDDQGVQNQVLTGTQVTLKYEGGMVGGSSGCNQYSASAEITGNQFQVGLFRSTMMACPDPVMEQERQYLGALEKSVTFEMDEENLVFFDQDGKPVLSFSHLKPVALEDTLWQILSYNNGKGGMVSAIAGTSITAIFSEDGTLSGTAGCNNYTTTYELESEKISLGPAATTRKLCNEPEGMMEQETLYLQALQSAESYRIEADQLTLYDENGTRAVEFRANKLVGEPWYLVEIQYSNDTSKTPDAPMNYSLEFQPDGNVQITADCNLASGTYTSDGVSLSIELGPMTLAACPPESLSDEFLQNLEIAASFIIDADTLYIAMSMDVGIMKFTQQP